MVNNDSFVKALLVVQLCNISRSTLYRLVRAKKFPPPRSLTGKRSVGWLKSDVHEWIESRPIADAFVATSKGAQT